MDFDFFLYENFFWPWWESLKWVIRASLYSHTSGCWITLPRPPTLWNLKSRNCCGWWRWALWCHTGSFTGRYQLKGNTHGNIQPPIMKPPAVDRVLSRDLPSMATHSCPHIIQLLLKKKKKKLLNIDFYNVCFADNVSPEYHEITNFSYKVLMQF